MSATRTAARETVSNDRPRLRLDRRKAIVTITLDAPPANALSLAMLDDLADAVEGVSSDESVRVVLLRARGTVFSAGHDLKEITAHRTDADGGRAFFSKLMVRCSDVMQAIVRSPKPFVGVIEGTATAAGCQLVASCDLAIATEAASFATPGVNIGLFCSTPMVALSRNVAPKHAMEMLLTGERIDARAAREIGLVNRVVPPEYLEQVVETYARSIASKPSRTVKIGKEAFYAQAEMPLSDAYDYAGGVMVENMLDADAREGIGAFVEKREPNWSDR